HILNPADNFAEFGWETIEESFGSLVHNTPHEGARVMAWFRPPVAAREYNVNFSCEGLQGHSLVLKSGGDTETIHISTDNSEIPEALPLAKADAGTMFEAHDLNWKWFSLSSDQHWRFLSFEVVQLPATSIVVGPDGFLHVTNNGPHAGSRRSPAYCSMKEIVH